MPVTKSAKKALRVSERRHAENLIQRATFKTAIKTTRKAVASGSEEVKELFTKVQSSLDRAAKSHTIHPNKAARLKSRLSKLIAAGVTEPAAKKPTAAKKTVAAKKKTTAKKTA